MPTARLFLYSGIGVAALAAGVARADSFAAKTGAWETTSTVTTTGMMIPSDMLAKLPPDRRAKIEQAMQAHSGQPHTSTHKSCVTQKDLDEDRLYKPEHASQCTRKVLSKSSTRVELEQTCDAEGHTFTMHLVVQAQSPEAVTMTGDTQLQGGGKSHFESHGRWLGASCAGIEKD
jgi:hypothetical protein